MSEFVKIQPGHNEDVEDLPQRSHLPSRQSGLVSVMMAAMLTLPLLNVLNQAIAALESRLTQPVSIAQVARQVGYSRYHFGRTFLVTTGMTPITYLRKRRLSEAARELATSAKPILEIALDYQFQSQEAFSRSFKQEFGVSPGRYRLQRRLRWLINKITFGAGRLLYPGRGITPKPTIVVPERRLVATILLYL